MTRAQVKARRAEFLLKQQEAGALPITVTASPTGGSVFGRRGLPKEWVDAMYADYQRLQSLREVGKLYGRTRQSIFQIFSARKLPLGPRHETVHEPVHYGGRKYTPGKGGYLRDTNVRKSSAGRESMLQRVVWREHRGEIPPGHEIIFKDGNKRNCAIENLECLPRTACRAARASGRNQFTRSAPVRLSTLLNNFSTGRTTVATVLKR